MKHKQFIFTAMMMLAAITISPSQGFFPVLRSYSQGQKERLDKVYAIALASKNKQIVESALAIVTMMKLDLPNESFPLVSTKIEELKSSVESPSIRYKAFLAGAVFSDPAKFQSLSKRPVESMDDFFASLDGTGTTTILSSK